MVYGGVIIVKIQVILLQAKLLKSKGIFEDITVVDLVIKRSLRVIRLFFE